MHEIVTLQFGERSNYLGTHYWNTQVRALPQSWYAAHLVNSHDVETPLSTALVHVSRYMIWLAVYQWHGHHIAIRTPTTHSFSCIESLNIQFSAAIEDHLLTSMLGVIFYLSSRTRITHQP
jgi:hypothetical protein